MRPKTVALAGAAAAVALALGAAAWYLRGTDPDVVSEIESTHARQYCDVTVHRILRALREWAHQKGTYPSSLEDLVSAGLLEPPFDRACPLDSLARSGDWSYAIAKNTRPGFPGAGFQYERDGILVNEGDGILLYEIRPNHESIDSRNDDRVRSHRVVTGNFRFYTVGERTFTQLLRRQGETVARVRSSESRDLVSSAGERAERAFTRALAAQELAARDLDTATRAEAARTLERALAEGKLAPWVALEFGIALERLGSPAAAPAILDVLARLRRPGSEGINYIDRERATRAVLAAIPAERREAYASEAGTGPELGIDPLDSASRLAEGALRLLFHRCVDRDIDAATRETIRTILLRRPESEHTRTRWVKLGEEQSTREDPRARTLAAEILGRTQAKAAPGPLSKLAADDTLEVRRTALIALGDIRLEESIDLLVAVVSDENVDEMVRVDAAKSLQKLTGEEKPQFSEWKDWWNPERRRGFEFADPAK